MLFLACRPPFFYPAFVEDSSRICGDLCRFIGGFERFHLDELGADVKMNGMGCLDGWDEVILTEGKWYLDGKKRYAPIRKEFGRIVKPIDDT